MKILLVGEFSGFHNGLKKGLEKLGHTVKLAGSPDGFKEIPVDINLWPNKKYKKSKIIYALFKQFTILNRIKNLKGYDVIQFISPMKFNNSLPVYGLNFNKYVYNKLLKQNNKSFLVSCGSDPIYKMKGIKHLDYNPIEPNYKKSNRNLSSSIEKKKLKWNIELASKINGVIPAFYHYEIGYKQTNKRINLSKVIQMPISTTEYSYQPNEVGKKIKILHGITRSGFKGSGYIIEVLEKIEKNYPDQVDIEIVERLSLNDYLGHVKNTNILMDQCNSYGYGINALIGMAYGKVVLSGAEDEVLDSLGVKECPVINIKPNVDDIYNKIENIVLNKNGIVNHGEWSRKYVVEMHDSKVIAQKYLEFWESSI